MWKSKNNLIWLLQGVAVIPVTGWEETATILPPNASHIINKTKVGGRSKTDGEKIHEKLFKTWRNNLKDKSGPHTNAAVWGRPGTRAVSHPHHPTWSPGVTLSHWIPMSWADRNRATGRSSTTKLVRRRSSGGFKQNWYSEQNTNWTLCPVWWLWKLENHFSILRERVFSVWFVFI